MTEYALSLEEMTAVVNQFCRISGYQQDEDVIRQRLEKILIQKTAKLMIKSVDTAHFVEPCKYYPSTSILGFTRGRNDEVAGVFVKE